MKLFDNLKAIITRLTVPGRPEKINEKDGRMGVEDFAMTINWSDLNSKVSKYFTVKECTWLPSWGCVHLPSEVEKANIILMSVAMDQIREIVGKPINVHVWIRPTSLNNPASPHHGSDYNGLIGGAKRSAHILGLAVDWSCNEDCNKTRATLLTHLERLGVRMERHTGPWVHNDLYPASTPAARYFFP